MNSIIKRFLTKPLEYKRIKIQNLLRISICQILFLKVSEYAVVNTTVEIAKKESYRAVTHNKGVMNGVDAVVLATGNDFRAIEAGVHSYASKSGQYTSLSNAFVKNDIFHMELVIRLEF